MNEENNQPWLIPEVGESIEDFKARGIGKISDGEVFKVPNIIMDEEAKKALRTWPLDISSRRIINNKPFAHYAELEPSVIYDFKDLEVDKIEFRMISKNCVEIKLTLPGGRVLSEQFVLYENGKVKHIWAGN